MKKWLKNTTLKLLSLLASWIRQQVFLLVCGLVTSTAQCTLEWMDDWCASALGRRYNAATVA